MMLENVSRSELSFLIEEWIHNERDCDIMRRHDSRGHYMDDGYSRYNDGGYNRGYSAEYGTYRADSYGHSDEEEKEYLRWKMQNAKSEQEREKIRRKLEQM